MSPLETLTVHVETGDWRLETGERCLDDRLGG